MLRIEALEVEFGSRHGPVRVLDGVDLSVGTGEAVAVVGESGSGKSMTALAAMGLLAAQRGRVTAGSVWFDERDSTKLTEAEWRRLRGRRIGMVFQDPMSSLNPVLTVGRQLTEHMKLHLGLSSASAKLRAIELMEQVGIARASERIDDYPHMFSGGMRQRVMIAMAIACNPDLLIADEPTTALDVTVQDEIIDLIMRLRAELGMSVMWITHDLASIAGMVDRVAIMYAGRIVETASTADIFSAAAHPYTRALLASIPRIDMARGQRLASIEGTPPDPSARLPGCSFRPRCLWAVELCARVAPPLIELPGHRFAACHRALEILQQPNGDR